MNIFGINNLKKLEKKDFIANRPSRLYLETQMWDLIVPLQWETKENISTKLITVLS